MALELEALKKRANTIIITNTKDYEKKSAIHKRVVFYNTL